MCVINCQYNMTHIMASQRHLGSDSKSGCHIQMVILHLYSLTAKFLKYNEINKSNQIRIYVFLENDDCQLLEDGELEGVFSFVLRLLL